MSDRRRLLLAHSFWPQGRHGSSWRLPGAGILWESNPAYYRDAVLTAERGLFDYVFVGSLEAARLPDVATLAGSSTPRKGWRGAGGSGHYWSQNTLFKADPFTTLAYLAGISNEVGLIATFNTVYHHPYSVARQATSLDLLSGGRAGLNAVTGWTPDAARNFGLEDAPTDEARWAQAEEFVQVLRALWDGWEDGWLVGDKDSGIYMDPSRVHAADFRGQYFDVAGPLNLPPSPQRRLPLVVAGTSERSVQFGGEYADIRFVAFNDDQAESYRVQKDAAAAHGRDPESYIQMAGVTFYVGESSAAAHAKFREVQELSTVPFEAASLGSYLGVDLGDAGPDEKVNDVIDVGATATPWLIRDALAGYGSDDITLAELDRFVSNAPGNQPSVVGSGHEVADWIEESFVERKFDGVVVFSPYQPDSLDAFVDLVVPELQRRGLFRTSYEAGTLRGRLGLS
ncbi:NtaA/DmoA family FMN-dependent monooxygenase [Gordonia sp. ABSL11-1]|uniref:NtaA/DmoA family FMN-dependent monooxygenase n=1 Tax=Gordonia sp. ABSL11-1 TaxID=3053924 RepID=UPI002573AB02|nr:NtaA/DmoA family FMN-dependent monooxygenase [Gordonia sp. ABSL11-1]MDL9948119.1 NtaA/DmoA family FMN-dependent monooxygenase [Gordonia sp. ABSL11-1]